jgi:hypothetical protein
MTNLAALFALDRSLGWGIRLARLEFLQLVLVLLEPSESEQQ